MKYLYIGLIGVLTCACGVKKQYAFIPEDEKMYEQAVELAHKYIITDGHVDLPYRLKVQNFQLTREYIGIPVQTDNGDFDFERAKAGGLDVPFMSIYIPARLQQKPGSSKALADTLIDMVQGIIEAHPDKFAAGHTPALCRTNFELGKISLPMGMENGSPIETDLKNIQYFYDRGIRYVTLTHSKDNQICDSSYDTTRTWGGLSPFGYQVVSEMNKVGMMIDISHVSDSTFYQVMRLTSAPCIASHSSCRKFTPGFERNMSDDMIRVLGENGGVIQINFGSTFIDGEIRDGRTEIRRRRQELLDKHGLEAGDDKAKPLLEKFKRDNQDLIFSDVEMVANHIDHAVKLAGINHVGFGSDYDGVGDSLPTGLKDVSQYPNLIYVLLKRGYSPEDIEKLCYKNVWRVWNTVTEQAG